ncbi:MAG: hypothetical protein M9893_07910, partial [Pyrinomonadaceae bacterium]|nr:hypothetical protein [Pyrinomonadaceae bacterium]
IKETNQNIVVLVSILVDIMYKSPQTYPIASAILSKLLSLIPETDKKNEILDVVSQRFEKIPNTGHLKIWLQRLTIKLDRQKQYSERLCEKVNNQELPIWNSDWLEDGLKTLIENTAIIDEKEIAEIDTVIAKEEVELFKTEYDYAEQRSE